MDLLHVNVTRSGQDIYTIAPKGAIDSDTYVTLQKKVDAVVKSKPKVIIFDMQNVDYMSSMGINVILQTRDLMAKAGGSMLLINLKPQIKKIFDIIKAIPDRNIFTSRDELDRYLASIQRKEISKRKPF